MKKYSTLKIVSPEEFNKEFFRAKLLGYKIETHVYESAVTMLITNKLDNKFYYKVNLTNGDLKRHIDFGNIAKQIKPLVHQLEGYGKSEIKCPEFGFENKTKIKWDITDPGNFSYINECYANKDFIRCWSYDLNSAYSFAMLQDMPDTTVPAKCGIVGENELGFSKTGKMVYSGSFAHFIFPKMESPFKAFVSKYYKLKANSSGEERQKYKDYLNVVTGMIHNWNIFIRIAILAYAADYISSFIDDDTLYCNVDSIISKKERFDLPIGNEIGKFKTEHVNELFKFKNVGIYQWEDECHYSGIRRDLLKDIYDVNTKNINKYRFDEEKGVILNEI